MKKTNTELMRKELNEMDFKNNLELRRTSVSYSNPVSIGLINEKLEEAKENDANELYDYIVNNKSDSSKITKNQIIKAFENCHIDLDEKEIDKMIDFIKHKKTNGEELSEEKQEEQKENENENDEGEKKKNSGVKENVSINRDEFKEFYVETK